MNLPGKVILENIYGESQRSSERFSHLAQSYIKSFKTEDMEFFSSPGRTEIIGNHTDHNGGKILAASIDMDTIGAAFPNNSNIISIVSEGYEEPVKMNLFELDQVPKNRGTLSLVAGIISAARNLGFKAAGFNAYISTNVISAAGVSSSPSFEMLICSIINYFFNDNALSYIDYARIGQNAENIYWGKASGLMDQMACAVGGVISLDFSKTIEYKKIDFSFSQIGYDLVIINTGKGHADLSHEYSQIPDEMKLTAKQLGKSQLSEINLSAFLEKLTVMEKELLNDRALLRALHFYEENQRVEAAIKAIQEGNNRQLLSLIKESGNSSWKWLQNCYSLENYKEQKVALALALSEMFIKKIGDGCCRVHGGGFAGVIISVIPKAEMNNYINFITRFIKADNIYPVRIRQHGAIHLNN